MDSRKINPKLPILDGIMDAVSNGLSPDFFSKKTRNGLKTVSTLTFFEVYFGTITGGLFEFFPKSIHRCILFEVNSAAIRTGLTKFLSETGGEIEIR